MKVRFFLTVLVLFSCVALRAFDRDKTAKELENIKVTLPKTAEKRTYDIQKGTPYAVSAVITAQHKNIAWIEVKLFENNKQIKFYRSARNTDAPVRMQVAFDSERADKAEVYCMLLSDAMPGSSATFSEFRVVKCENAIIQPWTKRGPSRCGRKITPAGEIILYPQKGRSVGASPTTLNIRIPNRKYVFSADVKTTIPGAARISVYCSGANTKPVAVRTPYNSKTSERLSLTFDTANFTWFGIELQCANGKKFHNKPVIFSNIQITPAP